MGIRERIIIKLDGGRSIKEHYLENFHSDFAMKSNKI